MTLPLQQSAQFAHALDTMGVHVVSREPVIIERRFGVFGTVRFASRITVDALDSRPRIINGEEDDPDRYRACGYRQIISPAHVARWDLTCAERQNRMSGKWRNQLRKGQSVGLKIREYAWDGAPHWLFDKAAELAQKRRFRALPTSVLAAYAQANKGAAMIFETHHQNAPVAACLILRHGAGATYQTAWTSDTGKAFQAPRVLLVHVADRMSVLGHEMFDLGVVETDTAAGLARFKLGTGAQLVRLGGTWVHMGLRSH